MNRLSSAFNKNYFSHLDLSHWEHWVNWLLHRERVSFKSDQSLTVKIILSACLRLLDLLWQNSLSQSQIIRRIKLSDKNSSFCFAVTWLFLPSLRTLHPLIWFFMNRLTIFLVIRWSWKLDVSLLPLTLKPSSLLLKKSGEWNPSPSTLCFLLLIEWERCGSSPPCHQWVAQWEPGVSDSSDRWIYKRCQLVAGNIRSGIEPRL